MSKYRKLATGAMALLLGASLQMLAPAVHATGNLGALWSQIAYPISVSDNRAADSQGFFCALCHATAEGEGRNPYGSELAPLINSNSTQEQIVAALRSIEGLNSDNDPGGFSNIAEINAGTQPGWKAGDTVPVTLTGDPLDPAGVPADIAVAPASIDFGAVVVGTSVTGREVTITNAGAAELRVTGLTLTNPVFTLGVSTPPVPIVIAAGASVKVGVVYKPDGVGLDSGALQIASLDPDEPLVTVALSGTGITTTEDCFASVDPPALVYGQVMIGSSVSLPVTLTNNGVGTCVVALEVPTCIDREFLLTSTSSLAVGPGQSSIITVSYTPVNLGQDQCRIGINTQSNDLQVPMSGEGVDVLPTDLDIKSFSASKKVTLKREVAIVSLSIAIQNNGTGEAPGILTITGQQGSNQFVHQVVRVSDPIGRGATRISLQSYVATEPGEIHWTATLQDGDLDEDVATATTVVQQ